MAEDQYGDHCEVCGKTLCFERVKAQSQLYLVVNQFGKTLIMCFINYHQIKMALSSG